MPREKPGGAPHAGRPAGIALFIAILAGFMTPFDLSAVNIALPAIGAEFSMDAVSLTWVSTAYLLASAIFLVPIGRVADIHGRKRVFSLGISLFTFTSLALVFSPSSAFIILLRFLQGTGAALIFGTAVAILTSVTPPEQRGRAIGIYTTAVYIGLSVGPFLGGLLTAYLGWRSIFLVNVPIGLFTIGLVAWKLKGEWAECCGEPFDLAGSVLYILSIVSVMYGFSLLPGIPGMLLILAGIALLGGFLWWEARTGSPVVNVRILARNRVFAFSNLAALINYSATFAVTFFLSLYLQYIRGYGPQAAGAILVVQPVVMALFASPSGALADRGDPGRIASCGMALSVASLVLLLFIGPGTSLAYLVACMILLGLGLALFASPNTTAIMGSVERRYYGVASGTLGTMRLVGQMLSMGIATMILALFVGKVAISPEYYGQFLSGMRVAFLIFALLCGAGILLSLARGRQAEPGP